MISAENLVPGNECVSNSTNESSITQTHGEGAKTTVEGNAAYKVVRKITCLGSGFVGGEFGWKPSYSSTDRQLTCLMA